ncbi:MAG TPA: amino acid-binding protein [Candidatus Merdiplasma excrementigallinarum]|uniref:Amino acid-binding protein n=1 Tax=Candidatus Merdiplasma excrementigallinarum TaxID=2840864 RepID=A0A9D1NY15_9FIRM|nr:amino acid-binding protein [Candidatus Merdiplasma excrementigallinarum]
MLKQVSVFVENSRGIMQQITDLLEKEKINIWGSVTNDGAEFGIVRMVVSDPDRALEKLKEQGYLTRIIDVMGVELEDEVGNLNRLLLAFAAGNINVNYSYLSFNRDSGKPVLIFQTEDIWEAEDCIAAKGFTVL